MYSKCHNNRYYGLAPHYSDYSCFRQYIKNKIKLQSGVGIHRAIIHRPTAEEDLKA